MVSILKIKIDAIISKRHVFKKYAVIMTKQKRMNKSNVVKTSYHHKPDNLTVDQWQVALRIQFAESQSFNAQII